MFARLTRLTRVPLAQEGMGSGDTHTSASPVGNGVRRSPVSPTGSTRGALKSPTSISKLTRFNVKYNKLMMMLEQLIQNIFMNKIISFFRWF